jgi:DNA polymerase-1
MKLLIVDGHAYAYRAFHAIRGLRSPSGLPREMGPGGTVGDGAGPISQGKPTNAIYGFVKMLAKMRAVIGPTHLIVVWDGGLSAERMTALPEYKAHRPEMPDDLKPQLGEIVGYLKAAEIASFCRDGVEADDYIACLARRASDAGMAVVIASSDKDFMQLVSARVGLLNPNDKSETVWTDGQVRAKAGVEPAQIVDWLSLMGDSVDNIPGVPGVGPKTAADLLKQFGSVAELFRRLDEVKSEKVRAALHGSADAVRRNRELVRLKDDLPCDFSPAELAEKPADAGRLRELFARWGFRGMLAALEAESPRSPRETGAGEAVGVNPGLISRGERQAALI